MVMGKRGLSKTLGIFHTSSVSFIKIIEIHTVNKNLHSNVIFMFIIGIISPSSQVHQIMFQAKYDSIRIQDTSNNVDFLFLLKMSWR